MQGLKTPRLVGGGLGSVYGTLVSYLYIIAKNSQKVKQKGRGPNPLLTFGWIFVKLFSLC